MNRLQQHVNRSGWAVRYATISAVFIVLIVLTFIISMNTGFARLSPLDVVRTLFGGGTDRQGMVLFEFRLPRIVISVLVGMGLAVSGCIMQGVTRNALADPGILGINAGAGVMVILYVIYLAPHFGASLFFLPVLAVIGAGGTAALVYVLAYKKREGITPSRLILTGIAVGAGIGAAMTVLTLRLEPRQFQFVSTWLSGTIWGTNWDYVGALLPWILVLLPFAFYKSRVLNILNLGDQLAAGVGAKVERERLLLVASAVGLTGACVAVGGGIGFVGLIGPHLARRLVGPKHQLLLPLSAMAGALLLIVGDTLARWLIQPSEIPTGIVVAVIGAPYFLYLLARSR
ncbi:FecCD family ABC transporter permease [Paenibacillus aurantiacus]|uniref:FecCD family ABC transporter permease n=1 Tax=Paenibacillus aurantiacus TaxID=1936118 RepID=A0ABV5KUH8_9BACL